MNHLSRVALLVALSTASFTGCHAGFAPPYEYVVLVGGRDGVGDKDYVYVQHATRDAETLTLTTIPIPTKWRDQPREPLGDGRWTLSESTLTPGIPLESLPGQLVPERVRLTDPQYTIAAVPRWRIRDLHLFDAQLAAGPEGWHAYIGEAHGTRSAGLEVFLALVDEGADGVQIELHAAAGWPIEWVRVATWRAQLPPLAEVRDAGRPHALTWLTHTGL